MVKKNFTLSVRNGPETTNLSLGISLKRNPVSIVIRAVKDIRSNTDTISQSGRRNFSTAADRGPNQGVFFGGSMAASVYNIH